MSTGIKKNLPQKPENIFKSSIKDKKLFKNDSSPDRVILDEWTLPNDKGFTTFLNEFDLHTRGQKRDTIKLWNDKENSPHVGYWSAYLIPILVDATG